MPVRKYPEEHFKPFERIMIFIDGGYLRKLYKDFFGNDNIDFDKVVRSLSNWYYGTLQNIFRPNLIRAYYYDGIVDSKLNPVVHAQQREYFDNIAKTYHITVVLGEAVTKQDGTLRQKGVDIELAIDALSSAYLDHFDSALFLLGDRDFIPLIDAVKNTGKKIYGFFYVENVASELSSTFDDRLAFDKDSMRKWAKTN